MKVISIFCVTMVIVAVEANTKFNIIKRTVDLDKHATTEKQRMPQERRRLSLFPRNSRKFTVTTPTNQVFEWYTVTTKRPLMARLTIRERNMKDVHHTPIVTRRPLMKSRVAFEKMAKDKRNNNMFNLMNSEVLDNGKVNVDQELTYEGSDKEFVTVDYAETSESIRPKRFIIKVEEEKVDSAQFTQEEEDDRNEFIFVKNEKATTEIVKPVLKRSVNIIEEENLGTTIAGFKFTAKERKLNDGSYFKNINV